MKKNALLFFLLLWLSPLYVFAQGVENADTTTVYITKTGSKYHKDACQYLRSSKLKTTLGEAKSTGYTACYRFNLSTDTKPAKIATAKQCTAFTKTGSRCKRKTKNANRKCWQHQ